MDIENLSSNWKRLQQKLGRDKPTKHKKDTTGQLPSSINQSSSLQQQRNSINSRKRKRASGSESKMGGYFSSPAKSSDQLQENSPATDISSSQEPERVNTIENQTSSNSYAGKLGSYVALDCEMVGTTDITAFSIKAHQQPASGKPEFSILARATLVNYHQEVIYDSYVLPPPGVSVTNYRTSYSGIKEEHLNPRSTVFKPKSFTTVQQEVASLITGRRLIGHALRNDLEVLGLTHPVPLIRDTSRYEKFRLLSAIPGKGGRPRGRTPALRLLASDVLGLDIQKGGHTGHDSAEDARTAMALFITEKRGFEQEALRLYGTAALGAKSPQFPLKEGQEIDGTDAEPEGELEEEDEIDEAEDRGQLASAKAPAKRKRKKKGKKKSRTKR